MTLAVLTPTERRIGPGETAYVWGAGTVVADGGRVHVGSGGRCLSVGSSRVSLVADGHEEVDGRPVAAAVMVAGDLAADGGMAWLAPAAAYDVTGTARLVPLGDGPARARGTVREGRQVTWGEPEPATPEQVWQRLLDEDRAAPLTQWLEPEPTDPMAEWAVPLRTAFEASGARVAVEESRLGVELTVRVRDPRQTLQDLFAVLAVPPTLTVGRDTTGDWWMLSTYGLRVRIVAGGRIGRWLGQER